MPINDGKTEQKGKRAVPLVHNRGLPFYSPPAPLSFPHTHLGPQGNSQHSLKAEPTHLIKIALGSPKLCIFC